MSASCVVPYQGSVPGADTNTYVIFSSVVAFPGKRYCGQAGYNRIVVGVKHPQTGTINLSKSNDRGTTWVACDSFSAASTTAEDVYDALIGHMDDFKVEWVNGGSAQTGWVVNISIDSERAPSV